MIGLLTQLSACVSPASDVDDRVMLRYKDGRLVLPEGMVDLAPLPAAPNDSPASPASTSESKEEEGEELSESNSEEEEQFSDIYSDGNLSNCELVSGFLSEMNPLSFIHVMQRTMDQVGRMFLQLPALVARL